MPPCRIEWLDEAKADAKPEHPFELPAQRLDPASAGCRIAVNGRQDVQSGTLLDGTNFFRNVRMKSNSLHLDSYSPWWWRT